MPSVSVLGHSGHHVHLACPLWPVNLCFSSDGRKSLCNIVSSSCQILSKLSVDCAPCSLGVCQSFAFWCRPTSINQSINQSFYYRAASNADAVWRGEFCLSVCPSVTRVDRDKTVERSVQIYIPYERTFILVF